LGPFLPFINNERTFHAILLTINEIVIIPSAQVTLLISDIHLENSLFKVPTMPKQRVLLKESSLKSIFLASACKAFTLG
jgi:hypothetical protein